VIQSNYFLLDDANISDVKEDDYQNAINGNCSRL